MNEPVKRKYKLNALALLLVLAIAYLAFALASGTLPEAVRNSLGLKNEAEKRAAEFGQEYSGKLLSYQDLDYGFNVSYPIGYSLEEEPDYAVRIRATARNPGFSSEVLDVYVSNSSVSEFDLKEIADTIGSQNKVEFSGKKSFGGREVFLLNTRNESEFTDEILYTRNAFYNCRTQEGQAYSAAIVFIVPEAVASDIELADYAVASFEC